MILHFTRPPLRAIELRQIGTDDRWQAVYAGDDWTGAFISTVARYADALAHFNRQDSRRGLPLVTMPGYFEEVAA